MLMRLYSIILLSLISPLWCGEITKLIIDTDMVGQIIILSPNFTPGCSAGHWCGRRWSPVCGAPPGGQGGGRAEGQLRGEYGWAERSRAGRQGRAQPGFSGILLPICILYTRLLYTRLLYTRFRLVHSRMVLLLWMTGSGWGDSQTLELQLSARGKADQGFSLFRTLFDVNVQTATV